MSNHIDGRAFKHDAGDSIGLIGVEMGKADIAGPARRQPISPLNIGAKGMQPLSDRHDGLLGESVIIRPGDKRENMVRHEELPKAQLR